MKSSVKKSALRNRQLRIESLEERQLLSVNPLGIDNNAPAVYAAAVPEIAAAAPAGYNASDWNIIESQGLKDYATWESINGEQRVTEIHAEEEGLTGSLNLSGLTNLRYLDCDRNELTLLNVSGCTNLQELEGYNNKLTSLDVSGCTNLRDLYCTDNRLTSLNVSGLKNLQILWCDYNQLTSLNVSGLTNLQQLRCDNNQLTSLDVSGCTNLQRLGCGDNQLTSLNVCGTLLVDYLNWSKYNDAGWNNTYWAEYYSDAPDGDYFFAVDNNVMIVAFDLRLRFDPQRYTISLIWDKVDGATDYIVQYKTGNDTYSSNGGNSLNALTITGLKPDTAYQFQVKATNDDGTSAYSTVLTATTLPEPAIKPTAPGKLTAKVLPVSNGKLPVQINWDAAEGATHYILHRWEEGDYKADGKTKNWKIIYAMKPAEQIPSGGTLSTFQVINSDVSKVTAKQVQYLVRGYNGDVPGESMNVFVTLNSTPVVKPTAPGNLTAKVLPVSNGKLPVQINWNAAADATHYILHRWEEGDYKADGKTKNWKVIYAMKPAGQIPSGGLLSDFQVINSDISKVMAKQVQYLVRGYNGDVPGESASVFVTVN